MNTPRDHHMYVTASKMLSEAERLVCQREGQRLAAEGVTTTQTTHYERLGQALAVAGSDRDGNDLYVLVVFHTEWQVALNT